MGRSWTRVFGRPTSVRAGSHDGRMAAQILDYHVFVGMQYIFIMHPQVVSPQIVPCARRRSGVNCRWIKINNFFLWFRAGMIRFIQRNCPPCLAARRAVFNRKRDLIMSEETQSAEKAEHEQSETAIRQKHHVFQQQYALLAEKKKHGEVVPPQELLRVQLALAELQPKVDAFEAQKADREGRFVNPSGGSMKRKGGRFTNPA